MTKKKEKKKRSKHFVLVSESISKTGQEMTSV